MLARPALLLQQCHAGPALQVAAYLPRLIRPADVYRPSQGRNAAGEHLHGVPVLIVRSAVSQAGHAGHSTRWHGAANGVRRHVWADRVRRRVWTAHPAACYAGCGSCQSACVLSRPTRCADAHDWPLGGVEHSGNPLCLQHRCAPALSACPGRACVTGIRARQGDALGVLCCHGRWSQHTAATCVCVPAYVMPNGQPVPAGRACSAMSACWWQRAPGWASCRCC